MIVSRDLIKRVEPFLKRREFIAIVGSRQCGKTTLLDLLKEHLVKKMGVDADSIKIITFEDRKFLMEFMEDPVSFVMSFTKPSGSDKFYLMIDEFQYAADGGQKLKLIYDTMKDVKIIVTGSSSLDIKAKVGKFMVGRMLTFSLYPFNFGERLRCVDERLERIYLERSKEIAGCMLRGVKIRVKTGQDLLYREFIRKYEEYAIWGGYPAVTLADDENQRLKIIKDVYNNYILKDIKTVLELPTERNLFLLSQYLAARTGSIVVYQNLGQVSELDHRKLKAHIDVLEETFICSQVRPFFKNRGKELSKNPKVYFIDMGFRNNLVENMGAVEKRPDAGAIIENTCYIRLREMCEDVNKINFWRTKAGAEVDFVVREGAQVVPIEIKYSLFKEARISKSLASFISAFNPERAFVATKNYWGFAKKGKTNIFFIPVYYL